MAKVGKERVGTSPTPRWRHIFRPRLMIYTALWAAIGVGLIVALFIRPDIDMTVRADRNPLFVTLADGTVCNTYG